MPAAEPDFSGVEDLPPVPPDKSAVAPAGIDDGVEDLPSLQQLAESENANLGTMFKASLESTPDRKAAVLELARQSGAPAESVDARFEDFQKTWTASKFDPAKWRADNPELAKLVLESPGLAGAAIRDEKVSWMVKGLRKAWAAWSYGKDLKNEVEWSPFGSGTDETATELAQSVDVAQQKFRTANAPKPAPTITAPEASETGPLRPIKIAIAEYKRNAAGLERSQLGYQILMREMQGLDTWDLEKKATNLEQSSIQREYGQGPAEQVLLDSMSMLPSSVESYKGAGKGAVAGGAAGVAIGATVGALAEDPAAITALAKEFGTLGAHWGAKAGTALTSFQLETGSAYLEYRNMKTDDGKPIPPEVARRAALAYGFFASAIETEAFGIEMKAFGLSPGARAALTAKAATQKGEAFLAGALEKKSFLKLAMASASPLLKTVGAEAGQEGAQNLTQDVIAYGMRTAVAGKLQKADPIESLIDAAEAARLGGMGAIGPGVAGGSHLALTRQLIEHGKALQAGRQVAALAGLEDSPTVKAAPEAVARMVSDATASTGEPVTHLYVDPHAFTRLFQGENADPREAATQLLGPDGPQKLMEARVLGEKLEIPVGTYLEKWGPTEAAKRLAEDTTTQPGLLTASELRLQDEEINARAKQLAADYQKPDAPPATGPEAVWADSLEKQLVDTGSATKAQAKQQIAVQRAFVSTMAERLQVPVEQLFSEFQVGVKQGDESVVQPAVPSGPERVNAAIDSQLGQAEGRLFQGSEQVAAPGPVWHSAAEKAAVNAKQKAGDAKSWLAVLSNTPGVKKEELELMGLPEWLAEQKGSVTKEQVLEHVRANRIEVTEKVLGEPNAPQSDSTQYELHTSEGPTPGSYRELLFYTPQAEAFKSSHFDEHGKGLLAHARISEHSLFDSARTKVLMVEEIQSDVHQQGREKGYASKGADETAARRSAARDALETHLTPLVGASQAESLTFGLMRGLDTERHPTNLSQDERSALADPRTVELSKAAREAYQDAQKAEDAVLPGQVPDAPFKESWEGMAVRRLVRYAAEKGYPTIAWTTGAEQTERYGLAKQVEKLTYDPVNQVLSVKGDDGRTQNHDVAPAGLPALIGKEVADRLLAADSERFKVMPSAEWAEKYAPDAHAEMEKTGSAASRWAVFKEGNPADLLATHPDEKTAKHFAETHNNKREGQLHVLEGLDLKVGGEGMRLAYDKRIPGLFKKIVEKAGGTVQKQQLAGLGGGPGQEVWTATLPEALRTKALTEGMPLFQEKEGASRGYTEFAREGFKRILTIALNKNADLSTFLHESGHVFFEVFGDLAERTDAPESVKADLAATLKWLGVSSRSEIQVEHHEKFARAFEAYLLEGKAPSPELVPAFERFKLWLTSIYRSIKSLNVELNDEIRGVFDRLLATDEEIDATKKAMGLTRLFASPEEGGMNPAQWQAYLQDAERATSTATRQAEQRVLKDRLQATEDWWKEEQKQERERAGHSYEELPARRAQLLLKGEALNDEGVVVKLTDPLLLDKATVQALVGKEAAKRLQLAKDGLHPDELADVLGYPTGKAMLDAVLAVPEKDAWTKQRASELMAEKHPEVLQDRTKMRELAADGLHSEHTATWLLKEWKALNRKAKFDPESNRFFGREGTTSLPPLEAIQRAAKLIVEGRAVGQLNVGRALGAERSAAMNAAKAATKGHYAQAAVFKQQQLLNMYLYRALTTAREERDAFEKLAGVMADDKSRARLGKASPIYRDGVDALLEAFELKQPEANREQPLPSLPEVIAQMTDDGATVMFDEGAVSKLLAKPREWKALTVAELRELDGALKNIRAAARAVSTALVDGKREDKAQVVAKLLAEAKENLPSIPIASSKSAESFAQKVGGVWSAFDGSLLKPEVMIRAFLGGGELSSTWFKAVMKPFQEAKSREVDLLHHTIEPIVHAWEKLSKKTQDRGQELVDGASLFPNHRTDMPAPTRRFELLMMALNSGNESNLSRLLEGRNITKEQLTKALNLLTKEELDWVQSVWDAAESLWPEASALEERDSGLAPPKVVRTPLQTIHGTYAGGYFPAVYDRRVEAAGEKQVATTIAGLMDNPGYTRPGTSRGHLKSRVQGFTGAISLEPSAISSHLAQVAHDIAFREAVKSVGGLILHPEVQAVLKDRLGEGRARTFLQWVTDVGQMRGAEGAEHAKMHIKFAKWLKANTVVAALGYSAKNAIEDLSNLPYAIARTELKSKHLAAAVAQFALSPVKAFQEATSKSGELRTRHAEIQRELVRQTRGLTKNAWQRSMPGEMVAFVKQHAFVLMEASDKATSTPVWMGSYRQALAEGKSDADAVTFADGVVRQVFPSHSPVDAAAILRDKGAFGATLMFYGALSNFYNGIREAAHPLHTADGRLDTLKRMPKVGGQVLAMMLCTTVLSEFLRGRGREGDEDWADWFMRKLAFGGLGFIPFAGDAANVLEDMVMKKKTNPRNASLVSVGINFGMAMKKLHDSYENDDGKMNQRAWQLLQSSGSLHGLPSAQSAATGRYLIGLQSGEREARNPFDFASGLIYGERDGQPDNPLNLIGNAVSGPR